MKTKLITSLRLAANALENGTFDYNWQRANRCNCGVVVCALKGLSANQLEPIVEKLQRKEGSKSIGITWESKVGLHCPITGIPTNKLFAELYSFGLTGKDIVELELLSNPEICKRAGIEGEVRAKTEGIWFKRTTTRRLPIDYKSKSNLIKYLRAWADILEEQGRDDVAYSTPQQEQVTI